MSSTWLSGYDSFLSQLRARRTWVCVLVAVSCISGLWIVDFKNAGLHSGSIAFASLPFLYRNHTNSTSYIDSDKPVPFGKQSNFGKGAFPTTFFQGEKSDPSPTAAPHRDRVQSDLGSNQSANLITPSLNLNTDSRRLLNLSSYFLTDYRNPCWKEPLGSNRSNVIQPWLQSLGKDDPWRLRCLPYFYVAGIPKCGTTDIYDSLNLHPDVAACRVKEPHWWAKGRNKNPFEHYVDMFNQAAVSIQEKEVDNYHPVVTGEGSPSTVWCNRKWALKEYNQNLTDIKFVNAHYLRAVQPEARIIITLRNPSERLYSEYMHFNGGSATHFHLLVKQALAGMDVCLASHDLKYCVYTATPDPGSEARINLGIYYVYLKDWLDAFPRDLIYVSKLEEYAEDRPAHLSKIVQFLELSPLPDDIARTLQTKSVSNQRKNRLTRQVDESMLPKTKDLLDAFYLKYNKMLAELLGEDKFLWL